MMGEQGGHQKSSNYGKLRLDDTMYYPPGEHIVVVDHEWVKSSHWAITCLDRLVDQTHAI